MQLFHIMLIPCFLVNKFVYLLTYLIEISLLQDSTFFVQRSEPLDLSPRIKKFGRSDFLDVNKSLKISSVYFQKHKINIAHEFIKELKQTDVETSSNQLNVYNDYLSFCKKIQEKSLDQLQFYNILKIYKTSEKTNMLSVSNKLHESSYKISVQGNYGQKVTEATSELDRDHILESDFDYKCKDFCFDSQSNDSGFESTDQDSKLSDDENVKTEFSKSADDKSNSFSETENEIHPKTAPNESKSLNTPPAIKEESPTKIKVESQPSNQNKICILLTGYIAAMLDISKFEKASCYNHAENFTQVFAKLLKDNDLGIFLDTFTHSIMCQKKDCTKLCFMFKRILIHVAAKHSHECALKHIYSHLIKMHLDTCQKEICGLPKCSQLKNKRAFALNHKTPKN